MAAPCWLDLAVDPNDRAPGRCYLGDPRLINDSPGGLGRFTTLRSWLSQWSLRSHACALKVGHRITADETQELREKWDRIRKRTEAFVRRCEKGDFRPKD
jgi:hypothetical protein